MPAPLEIIVGPADVYVAEIGTQFPDIDDAPSASWDLIGTLGADNYGESGVIIRRPQTTTPIRTLGSTMARKHVITETGLQVEFVVLDATAEQLALGYGIDPDEIDAIPASVGVAGTKSFSLPVSPIPFARAVLVRIAQSPYMEGGASQLEIPAANQLGNAEGGFTKGEPFQVTHIWDAVKTAGPVATWKFQTAVALAGSGSGSGSGS